MLQRFQRSSGYRRSKTARHDQCQMTHNTQQCRCCEEHSEPECVMVLQFLCPLQSVNIHAVAEQYSRLECRTPHIITHEAASG